MNNLHLTYLLARSVIGVSMLGHGIVRLPKLSTFSNWMVETFQNSLMPLVVVKPFSLALPVLELITGLLLLSGLFTKTALVTGTSIMLALIFGSCLIEKWEFVSFQMFYGLFFSLLLAYIQYNRYSLDHLINRK